MQWLLNMNGDDGVPREPERPVLGRGLNNFGVARAAGHVMTVMGEVSLILH